ncbi:hypothetical protein PanWU01x14_311740 [Parasponia andersonii]|uniref:Uncharacterized protein n=1 Tax=Parasponia andersonii TaxID=3476 RepID=A0A2P5APY9_PARAD|nr:hypothetical protein PanWU01x14_311740 [Parasponia andersonii]
MGKKVIRVVASKQPFETAPLPPRADKTGALTVRSGLRLAAPPASFSERGTGTWTHSTQVGAG